MQVTGEEIRMATDNKPAQSKRQKISKAQQLTMLEVLGASLILGTCLVLMNFITKYIQFNADVITAKNEAIVDYEKTIQNIGICADSNNDKRLSDRELADCKPNAVQLDQVIGSLRYNVFEEMAKNEDLESVARQRNENCYDSEGKRIDFNALYNQATDAKERQQLLQATKICSSLRVISDALPAQKNTEALMASLNQLFIVSQWEPENIAPRDETIILDELTGVEAMPVTFKVNGSGETVLRILNNIDRSIRDFDITYATAEWTTSGISLQARANAFFMDEAWTLEGEKTVRASDSTSGSKKK